jgi:hypothetical protein
MKKQIAQILARKFEEKSLNADSAVPEKDWVGKPQAPKKDVK